MGDEDRETLKLCPACGVYETPRPGCRVCNGRGLVSLAELGAYAQRQEKKRTSTSTKDVPTQLRDAIAALKLRRSAQVMPLVVVGEALLERFESETPSKALYTSISDWLAAATPVLNRER